MKVVFSEQYKVPAVVYESGDTLVDIIEKCRDSEAIYHEEGLEDELFVAVLRPEVGPELWTITALERTARHDGWDNQPYVDVGGGRKVGDRIRVLSGGGEGNCCGPADGQVGTVIAVERCQHGYKLKCSPEGSTHVFWVHAVQTELCDYMAED